MADGFERMVDEALAFFKELEANNSKAWFDPQKARYKDEIATPAGFFADLVAEDIARITGKAHSPKVFRIYRDVRFSKDKTPLNTHLHIMWKRPGDDPLAPAWFWGLSPRYFIMGMGIMGLQGESLARYRAFIDSEGSAVETACTGAEEAIGAELSDWGPEPLKRVPRPYASDHPQAALLKRKALAVHAPLPDDWRATGLVKATEGRIEGLMPLWKLFDQHL